MKIKCSECGCFLNEKMFCPNCGFLKDNPFRSIAVEEGKPFVGVSGNGEEILKDGR